MIYFAILLGLLLTACATGPTDALKGQLATVKADVAELRGKREEAVADLREFTIADARRSLVIAQAAGSLPLTACLPFVIKALEARQAAAAVPRTGAMGLFEITVESYLILHPPISASRDTIKMACAALVLQLKDDMAKLIAITASAGATGGLSGATKIPDALRAAPKVLRLLDGLVGQ